MITRTTMQMELANLRAALDVALSANLLVLQMTMRLHGVPEREREAVVEEQARVQAKRIKEALAACESALVRDAETLQ